MINEYLFANLNPGEIEELSQRCTLGETDKLLRKALAITTNNVNNAEVMISVYEQRKQGQGWFVGKERGITVEPNQYASDLHLKS